MEMQQRVLFVDPATGFYRTRRYGFDRYFGPADLGIHLTEEYRSLNFGIGIFAGSIFPGSNRMVVTGFSPCWQGYYISSMGGAGLVFDNLGINMLSLVGKAPVPSMLYLNRNHGEEIEVAVWVIADVGLAELLKNVFYEPLILGGAVKLHPLVVVIGVVGGGILFDLAGVLLAIPMITVLKVFVSSTARQLKAYGLI